MSFITLDFETFFRKKATRDLKSYSLTKHTYEEYIFHPEFDAYMVGVKIDREPTTYVTGTEVGYVVKDIFKPGNKHTALAHNMMFDGAIMSWYFGVHAANYYCTQAMSNALWNQASSSLSALAERLWPDDLSMRKGTELHSADGVKFADMSPELIKSLGYYCIQDVDLTFEAFSRMLQFFPHKELEVISLCQRIFIEPKLVLDKPRCQAYLDSLNTRKDEVVRASGIAESTLTSDAKFAEIVANRYQIVIPRIPSPTLKKPDNTKLALAKDDLEFLEIRKNNPELEHIWTARILAKSTGERKRAERLINHAQSDGTIAVPLKYSGAHTHRFSGTNSVNFQNFKRKSELRRSLTAPPGQLVYVADLANIEGRVLAWFAQETELLLAFKNKADIYSDFASGVYGRTINRKRSEVNEAGETYYPDEIEGFVGKVCVLGLGYGMGPETFQRTLAKGALGGPQIFFEIDRCVDIVYNKYRGRYRRIKEVWRTADRIIREMANPRLEPFSWRGLIVEHQRIRLPSGLYLNYPGLKLYEKEGREAFHYWEGAFWKDLYGGLFIENIIQALSRIIMTDMMLDIDNMLIREYNGSVVLTTHDEIVAVAQAEKADEIMEKVLARMRVCPEWCNDGTLVLDAEGGYDVCYSK